MKKQFIIRKYIMAESLRQAIQLDSKTPVHDGWVDEEWKKANPPIKDQMGFSNK